MEPSASQVGLLHRISSIVSSELSLDEMLGEIIGITAQVTECDACLVYLIERDSDEQQDLDGRQLREDRQRGGARHDRGRFSGGGLDVRFGEHPRGRAHDRDGRGERAAERGLKQRAMPQLLVEHGHHDHEDRAGQRGRDQRDDRTHTASDRPAGGRGLLADSLISVISFPSR